MVPHHARRRPAPPGHVILHREGREGEEQVGEGRKGEERGAGRACEGREGVAAREGREGGLG